MKWKGLKCSKSVNTLLLHLVCSKNQSAHELMQFYFHFHLHLASDCSYISFWLALTWSWIKDWTWWNMLTHCYRLAVVGSHRFGEICTYIIQTYSSSVVYESPAYFLSVEEWIWLCGNSSCTFLTTNRTQYSVLPAATVCFFSIQLVMTLISLSKGRNWWCHQKQWTLQICFSEKNDQMLSQIK